MDPKYFILILFCGHLNNTFFSPVKAITTEKQPQSTLLSSSVSYVLATSQNPTGNPLGQPTPTAEVSAGQPTAVTSPGKATAQTSAEHTLVYNTTGQPTSMANISSQQTAQPVFTSGRQLSTFAHASTRHPQPLVSTSIQQPPSVHTSSRKPVPPSMLTPSIQPTPPADERPPGITPGFITRDNSITQTPSKTDYNSIAAIIVGVFLVSMLVATIMIVLCKCLRKPVLNDQNWAGRSPFADGETPDMCLDNIRENEASTKRTSIISLMPWRPNKNTLLADDLEIKLFESSENIEDSNNSQTEKIKDQVNGTSEESAGGSTIGTAVSFSDDTDLPPPPPQLDLEGEETNQSDKPAMTILSPIPNDSTSLPPSLDCVDQICEEHNSELKQSFPPPPDSLNLPLPPEDVIKTLEDFNNEIQCQEISILPNADQDLSESLPPPPEEVL